MSRAKPEVNAGYVAGKLFKKLAEAEAEQGSMMPHDLGEFRKAYWKARCHARIEDLSGCVKYMRIEDLRVLEKRVKELYYKTLTDIYGEQGAKEFLENIQESKYRGEA